MITAMALAALFTARSLPHAIRPKPAPPVYTTPNYALTFRAPPHLTYCPLPQDWVGSDHGTTLFLGPPRQCGGAGFASGSRYFAPADTPRIEVYYGYAFDDAPARPCKAAGRIRFLGRMRPLCRGRAGGMITLEVGGRYASDAPAEASVRLVTSARRLGRDTQTLVNLANTVRACRVAGASPPLGAGPQCPKAPWY